MSTRKYQPPYRTLGKYLKTMRQQLQETLGETSGAVEIDVAVLDRIERGEELPSEDILLLLISHFGLQDDQAVELWQLAGYDQSESPSTPPSTPSGSAPAKQVTTLMLAIDTRVMYSNSAEILSDEAGLTISFGQTLEGSQPAVPISRVGMSYDQAERLLGTLQRVLLRRRYLPRTPLLGKPDAKPTDPSGPGDITPDKPEQPEQPGRPGEH